MGRSAVDFTHTQVDMHPPALGSESRFPVSAVERHLPPPAGTDGGLDRLGNSAQSYRLIKALSIPIGEFSLPREYLPRRDMTSG